MEFLVSRDARDRYRFDEAAFALHGDVVFADRAATRRFAQRINDVRRAAGTSGVVYPAQLDAMGLIHEVCHHVIAAFRRERDPAAFSTALDAVAEEVGRDELDDTLHRFVQTFPAAPVYRDEQSPDEYLAGESGGVAHQEVVLEELLLVWLANQNPAFMRHRDLFDDRDLEAGSRYADVVREARSFFAREPAATEAGEDLIDALMAPVRADPDSLLGQLRFIRERWGDRLGGLLDRVVRELDVLAEEERAVWLRFHPGPGGGGDADSSALRGFDGLDAEPERFSRDLDWMPRLVLIAKSTYVWLDQLSRRYGYQIRTLDRIPDEELDTLARQGFSGLWLIGLWERSAASQRIKQLRGNLDAVASAYSLRDYRIAEDLGGDAAYEDLRDRAWARGIRLASDMVPNHMGIDSRWVIEHPDWFVWRPDSPYPAYTFGGPNLSNDERVGIYIEDHYYDGSDAAVVFKRVDRWSGQERYVYHGNDGTIIPWNDTAQLDYLNAETREAVIRTILHVARQFPIIRFDAAMTLAKRHIQRLWYPEPGSAGAIPSRAESAMTKDRFDAAMPAEFWREVVDRVAAEAPDTLLLAEAFWLMEGYFVRTLGMHRVYNSAFMNMLRDERNAEYRTVVKNTLTFDPQILSRYVNFMNNPDERTAVDQFGSGDKYVGVATLLATMPGLPMFGHGQIEGFTERYGMEFQRAYLDEQPDRELVARHEREIFPLLHRRHVFADAQAFLLYDCVDTDGGVLEDVFAYSNRAGDEPSLVVYHNRYAEARGWIHTSVPFSVRGPGAERSLVTRTLAEGLGLARDAETWLVLRDTRSGMEWLRNSVELHDRGLRLELSAYQCHVFGEMRVVHDDDSRAYERLAARLGDRAVPSIESELESMRLEPLREAFAALVAPELVQRVGRVRPRGERSAATRDADDDRDALLADATDRARTLGHQAIVYLGDDEATPLDQFISDVRKGIEAYVRLPVAAREGGEDDHPVQAAAILSWLALRGLGGGPDVPDRSARCRARVDGWRLGDAVAGAFVAAGFRDWDGWRGVDGVRTIVSQPAWRQDERPVDEAAADIVHGWLADEAAARFIGVNEHDGITWFDRDGFRRLVGWAADAAAVRHLEVGAASGRTASRPERGTAASGADLADLDRVRDIADSLRRSADASGYRVDRLAGGGTVASGARSGSAVDPAGD